MTLGASRLLAVAVSEEPLPTERKDPELSFSMITPPLSGIYD
jgi:hypothetical protein